ncbi:MAG: zf-HC2 domain-containing protein [Gemmatimonadetes bacterium]|nr:zf-HC2 domain-containing protein [Gemmatimonadota bacterium]
MSHVDKGALHAYLDGALDEYPAADAERIREHLDRCAECADRLASERKVRSDAAAMLSLAAPDIEMPSLEDLRAYVKATRPKRTPAAVRLSRMGWAASMVLAVGAGWWVRDGQLQPPQVIRVGDFENFRDARTPTLPRAGQNELSEASGSLDAGVDSPASGPESDADAVVSTSGSASDDPARGSGARLLDDRNEAATNTFSTAKTTTQPTDKAIVASEEVAAQAARRDLVAEVEEGRIAESAVTQAGLAADEALESMRESQAPPADAVETEAMEVVDAGGGGGALSDVVADPSGDRVVGSVGGGLVVSRVAAPVEASQNRERRRTEPPGALRQRQDFGNPSVPEAERDVADERSWIVPGYRVAGVNNIGEGTRHVGVHWVQTEVEGENTIEVFRIEPGVHPAVVPAPSGGRNEVRAEVEGGWIILQAELTEEELGALLAKLLAEGVPQI